MAEQKLVQNCAVEFRKRCPGRWESLRETADETVRSCPTCSRLVTFCADEEMALSHTWKGECIAMTVLAEEPTRSTEPTEEELKMRSRFSYECDRREAIRNFNYTDQACERCGFPFQKWDKDCRVCTARRRNSILSKCLRYYSASTGSPVHNPEWVSGVFAACTSHVGIGPLQVISETTRTGGDHLVEEIVWVHGLAGLTDNTIEDFIASNRRHQPVEKIYPVDDSFVVFPDEEGRSIFHDDADRGWSRFRTRYPDSCGRLELSQIGFDQDVGQALIYAGIQVGGDAGHGAYMLFQKDGSAWQLRWECETWMS